MATDVISNLTGSLDAELEKARATLREVDDGIKKLFGKENAVGDGGSFGNNNRINNNRTARNSQDYGGDGHFSDRGRRRREGYDEGEPLDKRQRLDGISLAGGKGSPVVIGPRIRPRLSSEDDEFRGGKRLQSRIVSSGKEKSRDEVIAEQRGDQKGRDRNKRMFGALMGTLQRFKQDETKLKEKEEKRAQIEAKLDEAAKKERDEVRTKRQQLIRERKLRITEIKRLEIKRNRLADLAAWESKTKYLANFIRTEAKPHIFYMPKKLNPITECRLEQSKQYVSELIASKRKLVLEDLEDYEQRSKRYWERRLDGRETRKADPMDEDIEEELKHIMKNEDLAADDIPIEEDVEREVDGDAIDFKITVFTNDANSKQDSSNQDFNDDVAVNEGVNNPNVDDGVEKMEMGESEASAIVIEVKRDEIENNSVKMDVEEGEAASTSNGDNNNDSHSAHSDNESERAAEDDENDN